MKPKNLLLITADQWRGDCLSAVGHPTVKTPHLDALAAEGVVFRNHFTQCIPCGPSRASLYTGMYLQNHRVIENGVPLDARHTNIALELKKLGCDTILVGYTDTAPDPRLYPPGDSGLKTCKRILPGFDRFLGMSSEFLPDCWANWLKEHGYFLGIGIQPPMTSLGNMLGFGRDYLTTAWWIAVLPGVGIFLATLAMSILGDWVRDRLDPTLR